MSFKLLVQRFSSRSPTSSICHHCRRALSTAKSVEATAPAPKIDFAEVVSNLRIPKLGERNQVGRPRTPRPAGSDARFAAARGAVMESVRRKEEKEQRDRLDIAQGKAIVSDLERQMIRRWKSGDVYAPHDLSGVEMSKWKRQRRKPRPKFDVMDQLGMNPLDHYKNFSIMSEYMSEMGRIKGSNETGLRLVNQRKMAKAIRRAIGVGLMPGIHRHPEILREELIRAERMRRR